MSEARQTELLKVSEVAARLKCSKGFVAKQIRSGDLPAIRMGRLTRVLTTDLDTYIARCQEGSPCSTSASASGGGSSSKARGRRSASPAEQRIEELLLSKLPGSERSTTPTLLVVPSPDAP